MKIENLKSIDYTQGKTALRVLVYAGNEQQVIDTLVGKEKLTVYTDNTGEDIFVESIVGYKYLELISVISDGYYEVILSNQAPTLESVKAKVKLGIEIHDKSEAVNSFTLAGKQMWLDKDTRVGLVNSINIEKTAGKETTSLWFGGTKYTIPVDSALQMLAALELYALDCYNVTQSHIAAVNELQTIDEVTGYDYTAGYPEQLVFNL